MENVQLEHCHHRPLSKKFPLCFLAHDLNIPMNIGSLFRVADALGVEMIYLTGSSPCPPNSKIRKTSRAAEKYVPFSYEADPLVLVKKLKSEDYTIISLEMTSASLDLDDLSIGKKEKICLILGSERGGICQELLNASDKTVSIPMLGHCSSMNVAMACSIATFALTRKLSI